MHSEPRTWLASGSCEMERLRRRMTTFGVVILSEGQSRKSDPEIHCLWGHHWRGLFDPAPHNFDLEAERESVVQTVTASFGLGERFCLKSIMLLGVPMHALHSHTSLRTWGHQPIPDGDLVRASLMSDTE